MVVAFDVEAAPWEITLLDGADELADFREVVAQGTVELDHGGKRRLGKHALGISEEEFRHLELAFDGGFAFRIVAGVGVDVD